MPSHTMNYEINVKKIGDNITRLRKALGITSAELGLRCDMDRADLIHIEKGRGNPTIKTLTRIANELKVDLRDLL